MCEGLVGVCVGAWGSGEEGRGMYTLHSEADNEVRC